MRSTNAECIVRIVVCLIAGVVLAGLALAGRPEPARAAPQPYGIEPQPQFAHTAASSCSASACHGGGQVGKPGSEHTTWAPEVFPAGAHDPHSKAYRSLFNEDNLLSQIAATFQRNYEYDNVVRTYQIYLTHVKSAPRADWARSQIGYAYEQAGDAKHALQAFREIRDTNSFRGIFSRDVPRLQKQIKG